ncbi:glycosyltransferase [Novosphingobium pituita]|uniref:glycosyltransferase n=1 Tax=Novosphingobium pituita TaxID=3056842 RepID=UPI00295EA7C5|nr:glycosyltransferase [Novosphingobium sp. IK01]
MAIKALDEEAHIRAALETALRAVAPLGGRVVLADCGSRDATLAIARSLAATAPLRILTLAHREQRSCGAGAQLAYQGVDTPYFYLMDGDMRLREDFLAPALTYLEAHPGCAGVGGTVIETLIANEEFQIRQAAMAHEAHRREGPVDRLDGGGLYRTAAIRALGYFANANLQSFEEFDLAARLGAAGWSLARIDRPAVEHTGHATSGYRLLWRRFSSGRMSGAGQVLRAALGHPHCGRVLRQLTPVRVGGVIVGWWGLGLGLALTGAGAGQGPALVALVALPVLFLSLRRRSLRLGIYSFCQWNLTALAMIGGLARRQRDPASGVEAREITPAVPGVPA